MNARTKPSVCLFCSAADTVPDSARAAARQFGAAIAGAGIRLVFGGGTRGLMGEAALGCQEAGGEVVGIIPRQLVALERTGPEVGSLQIVETLSQRKQRMADLAGCFVCLPGGVGTLDEAIEMITWFDLGISRKPVYFCNVDGFWDPFERMMTHWRAYGVLRPRSRDAWRLLPDVASTVTAVERFLATREA